MMTKREGNWVPGAGECNANSTDDGAEVARRSEVKPVCDSELYEFRRRTYSATVGRWVQPDPRGSRGCGFPQTACG